MSRKFIVPDDAEIFDVLAVQSECVGDEPTIRGFHIDKGHEDSLDFSYDVLGRSVGFQWRHRGLIILDMFREGATRMSVYSNRMESYIHINFETDDQIGELHIQLNPAFTVRDRLLFN